MVLTKEQRIELLAKARAVKANNLKIKKEQGETPLKKVAKKTTKKAEPEPEPEPEIDVKVEAPIPEPPTPKPRKTRVKKPVEEVKSLDISNMPEKAEEEYDEVIYEEEVVKASKPRKKIIKKIIQEEDLDDEPEIEYQYETRKVERPKKTPVAPSTQAPSRPETGFKLFDY